MGKVEKKTKEKPSDKYNANKKKPESALDKLFGAIDQACIRVKTTRPDQKIAATNALLKTIEAIALGVKIFVSLNNSALMLI